MKDVIVDGTPVVLPDEGQQTVGDVIGLVSRDLDEKRRVIHVNLNGIEITGNPECHMDPFPEEGKLELKTGLASDLAVDALTSIEEFHTQVIAELHRASDEFRLGSFEKANEIFARCLDGLQVLLSTTHSVANLLQIGLESVKAGEQTLGANTKKISLILDEMIEAQTNRDGILLADLIEYELDPSLEDWSESLSELRLAGAQA